MAYESFSPDFSVLGNLPQAYQQGQIVNARRSLGDLAPNDYAGQAQRLLAAGDVEGGMTLARLGELHAQRLYERQKDERDFGLRERQLNATIEGTKVPANFERGPDGALRPVKGGPADPAYLQQTADAKSKPKEFSVSDVTKLSEEGGKYAQLSQFGSTFKPIYAGFKVPFAGNVATSVGRYSPIAPQDWKDAATWWQGYDRYKNVVRNDLFGSALTVNEQAAFEKADINPGMDPAQIAKNLQAQQDVVKNGLKRKANALIQSGYDPQAISAAYGVDVKELGATAQPRRGAQPAAAAPAGSATLKSDPAVLAEAKAAIAAGKPRDAVLQRMRERGFDPSGL